MLSAPKDEAGYELRVANIWRRFFEESGFFFVIWNLFFYNASYVYTEGEQELYQRKLC